MPSTRRDDATDAGSTTLKGLRVLVIEDGWQLADALKLLLERMGMVVAGPVGTTREARALARESCPDLAVVDVNLNGEMAYDLMDWLHERGTRIIVISGYEELPGALRKFSATLQKPFTATSLLTALELAMARVP